MQARIISPLRQHARCALFCASRSSFPLSIFPSSITSAAAVPASPASPLLRAIPLLRSFSSSAAAQDPYLHPALASVAPSHSPTEAAVPLAYRRSVLGHPSSPTSPIRLKLGEHSPPPLAGETRLQLVFLHCLLGDSRQFHLFESALHAALLKHNAAHSAAGSVVLNVWSVDLRNHGASPHTSQHSYEGILGDLDLFLRSHCIHSPILCGHSQGGKAALAYALRNSGAKGTAAAASTNQFAPSSLIILDAAPAPYTHTHSSIFTAMESVAGLFDSKASPPLLKQKRDVDEQLKKFLASPTDRAFVLSNLLEHHNHPSHSSPPSASHPPQFSWRVNLPVLNRDEKNVHGWMIEEPTCSDNSFCTPSFPSPCLFIGGGKSSRLTSPAYLRHLRAYFPSHTLEMVPAAGHFVHQSHAKECAAWVADFVAGQARAGAGTKH